MKKLICFALIAVLLLGTLVSCKSEGESATTAEESTAALTEGITEDTQKDDDGKKDEDSQNDDDHSQEEPSDSNKENKNLLMYSFSEDLEGCIVQNATTIVESGVVHMECNDTHNSGTAEKVRFDPKINICADDMPITGADYDICEIRCRYDVSNRTSNKTSTLFFWYGENSTDFYYLEYQWEDETSGDEWVTIRFDLSELLLWKNFTIYQIRWDPFECIGTCDIDYIAFYDGELEITEDDVPKDDTKPSIDSISKNAVVQKSTDYSLAVTASGGTAPYTYSWSDGTSVVGTTALITLNNAESGIYKYTCTVTDANGQSVTSKEVEVLVASNYKSYDFNTDGNNEGWTANSVLGTAIVENGAYYLLSDTPNGTRYDPQLTLIETFNGSDYSKCIVTYKYDFGNATKDYQATLFAWGNGDTVLSKDVMPATNVSEEYVTVIFDLSSWDGHTITKIRFDVCECAGTAYIDSIVFAG